MRMASRKLQQKELLRKVQNIDGISSKLLEVDLSKVTERDAMKLTTATNRLVEVSNWILSNRTGE